ncbi:MAG: hypothetical protein WAQ33_01620 [Gaiellaceae bacterium]
MLTFRLKHKARIRFTVVQVSPVCRTVGSFSVVGHRGINRVRFNAKLHGRLLPPGTYRIDARTRDRQAVLHLVVVIVASGTPSSTALSTARHSDVCSLATRNSDSIGAGISALTVNRIGHESSQVATGGTEGAQIARGPNTNPSAMGPDAVASKVTSPLALALLGLAVLLLGLAALPATAVPDPRLTEGLAHHRAEVVLAGAVALAAGIVALLLG